MWLNVGLRILFWCLMCLKNLIFKLKMPYLWPDRLDLGPGKSDLWFGLRGPDLGFDSPDLRTIAKFEDGGDIIW